MLTKEVKLQIHIRIFGYNVLSAVLVVVGLLALLVFAIVLFFRVGPREQYYFPAVMVGLIIASASSKSIALLQTEAEQVVDPILLSWYNEVAENTKFLGIFPLKSVFKPTLYRAKMGSPNAFACGLNLFFLAKLPVFGSAVVLSDELIKLIRNKGQMQAIMAHELGHITSLDVAIASALALINSLFGIYLRAGTWLRVLLGIEFLLVLPIWLVWKILNSTLSQIRELVADLKSVQTTKNTIDLANALSVIAENRNFPAKNLPFRDLFLSHPSVGKRVQRLREIQNDQ